jgi:hypothetical protein
MAPPPKPTYVIDSSNFSTFEEFVEECNRGFIREFGGEWHGNFDAFNDYFNWREGDYVLIWRNFEQARSVIGLVDMILEIIREQPNVELRLE